MKSDHDPFDEIEQLRTDYLRELAGLSKVFIAISTAVLGLILSPFGIELSKYAGMPLLFSTWFVLVSVAILGFFQVFLFSTRFKSRADYVWTSHIVDTIVQLKGSDQKLDEFLAKSDSHKESSERKYHACLALVITEGILLLFAFGLLAMCLLRTITIQG